MNIWRRRDHWKGRKGRQPRINKRSNIEPSTSNKRADHHHLTHTHQNTAQEHQRRSTHNLSLPSQWRLSKPLSNHPKLRLHQFRWISNPLLQSRRQYQKLRSRPLQRHQPPQPPQLNLLSAPSRRWRRHPPTLHQLQSRLLLLKSTMLKLHHLPVNQKNWPQDTQVQSLLNTQVQSNQ